MEQWVYAIAAVSWPWEGLENFFSLCINIELINFDATCITLLTMLVGMSVVFQQLHYILNDFILKIKRDFWRLHSGHKNSMKLLIPDSYKVSYTQQGVYTCRIKTCWRFMNMYIICLTACNGLLVWETLFGRLLALSHNIGNFIIRLCACQTNWMSPGTLY